MTQNLDTIEAANIISTVTLALNCDSSDAALHNYRDMVLENLNKKDWDYSALVALDECWNSLTEVLVERTGNGSLFLRN
jgi:hypothetical protein